MLLLSPLAAYAQSSIGVAPIISFDFGSPLFINRSAGVLDTFVGTANGRSYSTSYGLGIQAIGPGWIALRLDLIGRLEAEYATGRFTFDALPYSISGSEAKLLVEAGANWNLSPLSLDAGPWISQAIVRNISEPIVTAANTGSAYTHAGLFGGIGFGVPDFPARAELNTHVDLTEFSQAGSNAWSFGMSLAIVIGGTGRSAMYGLASSDPVAPQPIAGDTVYDTVPGLPPPRATAPAPVVRFLVDGAPAKGSPPLDCVEDHITEYTMLDSSRAAPKVTQWIDRSYHLPHLSLVYSGMEPGLLRVLNGGIQLFSKSLTVDTGQTIAVVSLDEDSVWRRRVRELRSTDTNRLIAELQENSHTARDTLLFPPADSSAAGTVITKHESRFLLLTDYAKNAGGSDALDLLLERIRALAEENPKLTIVSSPNAEGSTLMHRLHEVLGDRFCAVQREPVDSGNYVTVVVDY